MKELTIISKHKLNSFSDSLVNTDECSFDINDQDNLLCIKINCNKSTEQFYTQLSIFIVSTVESKLITKINEILGEKLIISTNLESIIEEELYMYYVEPIKVLIKEYFKYNTDMNLDSFIYFNCKGLINELKLRYNDYLMLFNQEIYNDKQFKETKSSPDSNKVDSSLAHFTDIKDLNNILCKIKSTVLSNVTDNLFADLDVIHLRYKLHNLELVSDDNTDLINLLQTMIPKDVFKELDNSNEHIKVFIYILINIVIFNSKQIIFHKSIPEELTSQILLYLYETSYLNEQINEVNFLKCKGCSMC